MLLLTRRTISLSEQYKKILKEINKTKFLCFGSIFAGTHNLV